ncbi:hypothetical protein AUP68_06354 [Ilyonectria robusta]
MSNTSPNAPLKADHSSYDFLAAPGARPQTSCPGIYSQSQETKDLAIPALPTGTVLIRPITHTLDPANSHYRFLSGKCSRRGLPVVPAFVLTIKICLAADQSGW